MKLDPKIFKKAAKIASNKHKCVYGYREYKGGCYAIIKACNNTSSYYYLRLFSHFFYQDAFNVTRNAYWMGERNKENSKVRANALLLCAEMCK